MPRMSIAELFGILRILTKCGVWAIHCHISWCFTSHGSQHFFHPVLTFPGFLRLNHYFADLEYKVSCSKTQYSAPVESWTRDPSISSLALYTTEPLHFSSDQEITTVNWGWVQKFHSSSRNYEWNLERKSYSSQITWTSNSSQSTRPIGQVLWKELLEHITPLCSLLHTLLKDKCMCLQDEWKL